MSDKPADPADFGRMRQEERDLRIAKNSKGDAGGGGLGDIEADFQREQNQIQQRNARIAQERAALEAAKAAPAAKPPNIKHLLVAKKLSPTGGTSKFSVVGFYSSRELLAENLAAAVMEYGAVGQTLGVVDFDLAIRLDQPAVPPS